MGDVGFGKGNGQRVQISNYKINSGYLIYSMVTVVNNTVFMLC